MFRTFLAAESGAITTDWVVLAAAAVGLGLGATAAVQTGTSALGTDIEDSLTDASISSMAPLLPTEYAAMNFTGGDRGAWTGGTVMSPIAVLGEILALGPGEDASLTIPIAEGGNVSTLSFDVIGGDSLDWEWLTIQLDNQTVSSVQGMYGTLNFHNQNQSLFNVTTQEITRGVSIGGNPDSSWRDAVTRVTIELTDPATSSITLGLRSGANQAISDEFFGIDNLVVTGQ